MKSAISSPRPVGRRSFPPPFAHVEMMVDGTWIAEGDRAVKKALRQDRGVERKRTREEKQKRGRRLHAASEDARIARRLARELAEWEIRHRRWGASVTVHGEPKKPAGGTKKLARLASPGRSRNEPGYFAVRDSQGRVGIYIRGDYVRAGGKGGKPGCAAAGFFYTIRDDAVLTDPEGNALIFSNLGKDAAEIAAAWIAVEAVARATRANAKIQFRFVLALDADASEAEKIDAVRRFGEIFDALGLPYSAAIHKPDPGGDDRNWHAHFLTSYRPAEQVAPGEWRFADDLVTALDGKDGMRTLRHLWAHAQTGAARRAGRDVEYTGLSHTARGLDLEAQTHLGPALSDLVVRGQHVPAHARNQQVAARNAERLRRRDLEQQRAALLKVREAVLEQRTTRSAREAAVLATAAPDPVANPTPRTPASLVRVVEPFNVRPTGRTRESLPVLPPRPRTTRLGTLQVRSVPTLIPITPRRPVTITTLPATPSTPPPADRTGTTTTPLIIVSPMSRCSATLRRFDVPTAAVRASAVIHATVSSRTTMARDAALVFDTPAQRGRPPREPGELFDIPHIVEVPRAAATIRRLPAPASDGPIPAWWDRVEHYLAWLAWRDREDDRARARLGGYAVLPPAYRAAVEAVERDPHLIVEEQARPTVRAGVPRDLAAQIEAVAGDPHWREFLRRVRTVALEREARAMHPIPSALSADDAASSPAGHSTSPLRDPRGPAHRRVRGLRPRRS